VRPAERPEARARAGRPTRAVVLSTIAAIISGGFVAVQTSANGHVSVMTGSPVLAVAINHGSGLLIGLLASLAVGAFPRAWRSLRARRSEIRWWWFLGGFMGFAAMMGIVISTPELGVVMVAVAITLGQLGGSVLADSAALGPGGKRPLSVLRIVGIGVAIIAIAVGATGHLHPGNLVFIPLVVIAGVIVAIQQAANGWILVVTGGEWAVMTVINFILSTLATGTALLIIMSIDPPDFSALPWWAPLGGTVGVIVGIVIAVTVKTIGVLSSMLCIAAGQAIASILVDLFAPVDAMGVTASSVVGAVLAVLAVALAGLGSVRRASSPARAARADGPEPGERHAD